MPNSKCLIIEDNPANFEILERLVKSFKLTPIKIGEPVMVLHYLEEKPTNLVIMDTDDLKGTISKDLTAKVRGLNPDCVVMWVCTNDPGNITNEIERPDILLIKPFGMRLFQQALVPYMYRHQVGNIDGTLN